MPSAKKQPVETLNWRSKKKEDEKEQLKMLSCAHGRTKDESMMQEYGQRLEEYFNIY